MDRVEFLDFTLLIRDISRLDRYSTQQIKEQLNATESLEWVQALNAGVDSYPVDTLAERGVTLTNASSIHAEQISQQVLGYMLVFERRIHEGIGQQRAGE